MYVSRSVSQRYFQQSHQINQIQQFQFLSQVAQNSEIMNQNSEMRKKEIRPQNQNIKDRHLNSGLSEFRKNFILHIIHKDIHNKDMNKDIFGCFKNIDKDFIYQTP